MFAFRACKTLPQIPPPQTTRRPVLPDARAHGHCIYRLLFWKESKEKGLGRPYREENGHRLETIKPRGVVYWEQSPFLFLIAYCDSKDDDGALTQTGNAFSVPLPRLAMGITLGCSYTKITIL